MDYFFALVLGFIGGILGIVACLFSKYTPVFIGKYNRIIEQLVRLDDESDRVESPDKIEIFEPTSPEVEALEAVTKENDKKGLDTKVSEL